MFPSSRTRPRVGDRTRCLAVGIDRSLSKPLYLKEFFAVIHHRGCPPESESDSDRLNSRKFHPRLTLLPTPRKLIWTSSRQGKWGSAVQIGRGPATVFGFIAESQATLPRRRGWAYFARGYASSTTPASRRVFYLQISRGNFVRGDSCNTVLQMSCVALAFSPSQYSS